MPEPVLSVCGAAGGDRCRSGALARGGDGPAVQLACPAAVLAVLQRLEGAGFATYLVGGCVRDTLLGLPPKDWDLATAAPPEAVMQLFDRVVPVGLRFGTVAVLHRGHAVEVSTFRGAGLLADLAARDFTINAMAWHPVAGLADPHGGRRHLRQRLVVAVGDAGRCLGADPLRMLRAVRLAAVLDFAVAARTLAAIRRYAGQMAGVAPERIQGELGRILLCPSPGGALRLLHAAHLLGVVVPELVAAVGFDQHSPYHRFDVFEHTCQVVDAVRPDLHLRLAALCHDLAKPLTVSEDAAGCGHFYGHAALGADLAERLLLRLRYDNETVRRVSLLVREHMFPTDMGVGGMRRLIRRVGAANVADLMELRRADMEGSGTGDHDTRHIDRVLAVLDGMRQAGLAAPGGLAVTGHDVMAALGLTPGPAVGEALRWLADQVLEEHVPNEPAALLAALQRLRAEKAT